MPHFILQLFYCNVVQAQVIYGLICYYLLYCYQRLTLKRLVDVSMGVITPLSEQLTKPLPNAMALVNLKELSTGAYKLLPEGTISIAIFWAVDSWISHTPVMQLNVVAHTYYSIRFIRHTLGCVCTWWWALWRSRNPQRSWCYNDSSWPAINWRKNQQSTFSKEVVMSLAVQTYQSFFS